MGQVIINADDFGFSRGVNYGIVDSYVEGITTSTTIMANGEAFDHAVALASEYPELGVGVHLNLTKGAPLIANAPSISADGSFHSRKYVKEHVKELDLNEVYVEWAAQIEKVIDAGIKPTHLDSHHHVHMLEPLNKVILSLALQYEVPIRDHFEGSHAVRHTDQTIDMQFAAETVHQELSGEALKKLDDILLQMAKTDQSVELIVHPGYLDATVLRETSLQLERPYMTDFLIRSDFAQRVREYENIELIHFGDLEE